MMRLLEDRNSHVGAENSEYIGKALVKGKM